MLHAFNQIFIKNFALRVKYFIKIFYEETKLLKKYRRWERERENAVRQILLNNNGIMNKLNLKKKD